MRNLVRPVLAVFLMLKATASHAEPADAPVLDPVRAYAMASAVLVDDGVRVGSTVVKPGYFGGGLERLGQSERTRSAVDAFAARITTARVFQIIGYAALSAAITFFVLPLLGPASPESQALNTYGTSFCASGAVLFFSLGMDQLSRADTHLHRAVALFNEDLLDKVSPRPAPPPVVEAPPPPPPAPARAPACSVDQVLSMTKSGMSQEQIKKACE
ncbi:MAG: hypothetical protein K1X89_03955 [Myxococcaceae bacterium]|nr:hypothetical protein [Myxococcaceae bacterium]